MISDYHMHLEKDTYFHKCRFTTDRMKQYVEIAQQRGLDEIGFSEHCNRFQAFEPLMKHLIEGDEVHPLQHTWIARSFREDLSEYVDALARARHDDQLPVKASLEVDFFPDKVEEIRSIVDAYPFDYIVGSVHFLGNWGIDFTPDMGWPTADVDQVYVEYFKTLCQAARSGVFDILAHPDLVKKFGHRPSFPLDELYDELALAAKEGGVAAEISTAGLFKPVEELYPHQTLLERFFDRGVPITLASDAHQPDHVGRAFDQALRAASEAGYRTITLFDQRRATQVPLG